MMKPLSLLLLGLLTGCPSPNPIEIPEPPTPNTGPCETWENPDSIATLNIKGLNEISGIVSSRKNPGVLWLHEDSGNTPTLFALNAQGDLIGTIQITNAPSIDWEDMAIGPCGADDCLFIADVGDNAAKRKNVSILRLIEPDLKGLTPFQLKITPEQFSFQYPDGPQDVEAMAITPQGMPVLFSKRQDGTSKVFLFSDLQSNPTQIATLNLGKKGLAASVTAADMLPDGSRVLIRAYFLALEYRLPQADILQIESAEVVPVPTGLELQGESIAYENLQGGFWHISEGASPSLFYAACE
jgi:hypothetical protein